MLTWGISKQVSPEKTTNKTQYNFNSGLKVFIFEKKCLLSRSQAIEIFLLPAVPTEDLDELRQPHFPTTPNSVIIPGDLFDKKIYGWWSMQKSC